MGALDEVEDGTTTVVSGDRTPGGDTDASHSTPFCEDETEAEDSRDALSERTCMGTTKKNSAP